MTLEQTRRMREIAAKACIKFGENYEEVCYAAEEAIIAALDDPLLTGRESEYICKCGLRVEPHRCKTGEEF